MSKQIKICDPLYDYIYLEEDEADIINHPDFQRLRSIRQLGFADQAFPSGTHNRYTHSLGACHLAGQAFDSIINKNKHLPLSLDKKILFRKALRLAALLHDIGHGPLSHSSESLMPDLKKLKLEKYLTLENRKARHEDYSLKFIMESLYQPLKELVEPEPIAQILHTEFKGDSDFFIEGGLNFLPLLRQIISSSFDVDRMDYLFRDSLSCGVKYGLIDFVWLLSHFDCHIKEQEVFLSIDSSALYTLESLILAREHMSLVVYFHHKSSIYNQMLKNYSKECDWELPCDILNYSQFTDIQLFEKLKSDPNEWAGRIIQKKPYLRLYESIVFEKSLSSGSFLLLLKQKLEQEAVDCMLIDSKRHSIKPSKSYYQGRPMFLKNRALNKSEPLEKTKGLLSLPSRSLQRLYVKPEQYSRAKKLLKSLL